MCVAGLGAGKEFNIMVRVDAPFVATLRISVTFIVIVFKIVLQIRKLEALLNFTLSLLLMSKLPLTREIVKELIKLKNIRNPFFTVCGHLPLFAEAVNVTLYF